MKNQKISIVVPVYNGEKTLRACLNSILNQIYKNYEVIVVDNNSTDKSKEIIQEFCDKDSRVKYVFEQERLRGAARNTGEKFSKGEVILMTDSDCVIPKNWVQDMIKPILDDDYEAVQGFEEEGVNTGFWSKQEEMRYLKNMEYLKNSIALGNIDTKNFAISISALKDIGFTNRKYFSGNDTVLSIQLQKNDFKLKYLYSARVKHFHPNSFKEVIKKYYYRAFWCTTITKDYKNYLKNTDFLKETNQTPWTFFKFFPGLARTLVLRGFRWAYYDFVTGFAWRIGLVCGWANILFKKF